MLVITEMLPVHNEKSSLYLTRSGEGFCIHIFPSPNLLNDKAVTLLNFEYSTNIMPSNVSKVLKSIAKYGSSTFEKHDILNKVKAAHIPEEDQIIVASRLLNAGMNDSIPFSQMDTTLIQHFHSKTRKSTRTSWERAIQLALEEYATNEKTAIRKDSTNV
jgi:hypothetical protein